MEEDVSPFVGEYDLICKISEDSGIFDTPKITWSLAEYYSTKTREIYDQEFFEKLPDILFAYNGAKLFDVGSIEIRFLFDSAWQKTKKEYLSNKNKELYWWLYEGSGKVEWDWKLGDGISNHPSLTEEIIEDNIGLEYYIEDPDNPYKHIRLSIWDFNVLLKKCTLDKELNVQQMDGTSHKVRVASYFPIECLQEIIKTPDHKQIYFANGYEEEIEKGTPCGELPDIISILLK